MVSVPVWPVTLSGRLLIEALVEPLPHQQANQTRAPPKRARSTSRSPPLITSYQRCSRCYAVLAQVSLGYSPPQGQVTHVLLTRLPLYSRTEVRFLVRLACVRHAASVRSEPGSNSPV